MRAGELIKVSYFVQLNGRFIKFTQTVLCKQIQSGVDENQFCQYPNKTLTVMCEETRLHTVQFNLVALYELFRLYICSFQRLQNPRL